MNKSNTFLRMVAEPILTRLGTFVAGGLVTLGLAAEHGPAVETVVVAVGLLGIDLVNRQIFKRWKW